MEYLWRKDPPLWLSLALKATVCCNQSNILVIQKWCDWLTFSITEPGQECKRRLPDCLVLFLLLTLSHRLRSYFSRDSVNWLTSHWYLEIGHGESIDTMETSKYWRWLIPPEVLVHWWALHTWLWIPQLLVQPLLTFSLKHSSYLLSLGPKCYVYWQCGPSAVGPKQ